VYGLVIIKTLKENIILKFFYKSCKKIISLIVFFCQISFMTAMLIEYESSPTKDMQKHEMASNEPT